MNNMPSFLADIVNDIEWRMSEIATVKSLPYRYSMSDDHKLFLIKYSVPTIYAIWEGYVKNSFEVYVRALNKIGLNLNQFSVNILTHSLEANFPQIKEPITNYDQSKKFANGLYCYFTSDFKVNPKVPTNANVNLKTLNKILERFSLDNIVNEEFNSGLNKLLKYRNSIAHGDNNIIVSQQHVFEFSSIVYDLMYEVFLRIEKGFANQSYLH